MSYILVLPARPPPHSQYVSIKKHQQSTGLETEVELTTAACVGMLAFAGRIYFLCFAGWNLIELVWTKHIRIDWQPQLDTDIESSWIYSRLMKATIL